MSVSPPTTLTCRLCGSTPAAAGRFRAHRGMVFLMQFRHWDGPFCRDCGIATFREATSKTLLQGWWGFLSAFITVWTLIRNVLVRGRFARLGAPYRDGSVQAPLAQPLDPGRPVLARPAGALGVAAVVLAVIVGTAWLQADTRNNRPEAKVGKCVQVTDGKVSAYVDCSKPHVGRIIGVASDRSQCPAETNAVVRSEKGDGMVLCAVAEG
jgi:hypothetical protein